MTVPSRGCSSTRSSSVRRARQLRSDSHTQRVVGDETSLSKSDSRCPYKLPTQGKSLADSAVKALTHNGVNVRLVGGR